MSKWKIAIITSITLNMILMFSLLFIFQQNHNLKSEVITQYATQQKQVLRELERALDNQDNKEEYIKALISAYGIIYSNHIITKSDTTTQLGKYIGFPTAINDMNSPYFSRAVGYSLINRMLDRSNEEWQAQLELYTTYTSQVVDKLDYENKIIDQSLRIQKQTLDEVSNLIEDFKLE